MTEEQERSFCHVLDTVAALMALLHHPDAVGDVFNIGTPQEITINGLAQLVIRNEGPARASVKITYDEAYEQGFEDMQRRFPDITKIRALTGWEHRADRRRRRPI